VIKTADWIIDLGPEGGAGGGTIVAKGTPEDIAASEKSYTGKYLRPVLERKVKLARKEGRRDVRLRPDPQPDCGSGFSLTFICPLEPSPT
jgi:excinuclease ABC subunit A